MAADLHNQSYGPDNARLAEAILALEPDAVLAAGDLLIGRPGETFLPALSLLRRLRRAQIPVYYGNGNHEYRMRLHPEIYGKVYAEYAEALRDCGVILLENEKASFEAEGLGAEIYGFELPESYYRKFAREELKEEELEQVLGKPDEEKYNILIAHNPDYFPQYADWGAKLVLSGHVHGGIMRLPVLGGVLAPSLRLFPKYDGGLFEEGDSRMVLGRGLGSHTIPIRLFNPGELIVVRLEPEGR